MMAERIAAVLERRADEPGRFEALARLLDDPQNRLELEDYLEAAIRRESGDVAARMYARARFYAELVRREVERLKAPSRHEVAENLKDQLPRILETLDTVLEVENAKLAASFAMYLGIYFFMQSMFAEGVEVFDRLIETARHSESHALLARLHLSRGRCLLGLTKLADAADSLDRASYEAEKAGDREAVAQALGVLGRIAIEQGDYAQSKLYSQSCLRMAEELEDTALESIALRNLGDLALAHASYDEAENSFQRSLAIARENGHEWLAAASLSQLGILASRQGQHEKAESSYREALAVFRSIDDRNGIAITLLCISNLAVDQGLYEKAKRLLGESLVIHRRIGHRSGVAHSLSSLGLVAFYERNYGDAQRLYCQALAIHRETGDQFYTALALLNLGGVSLNLRDYGRAARQLAEAVNIAQAIEVPELILASLHNAGILMMRLGKPIAGGQILLGDIHERGVIGLSFQSGERDELDEELAKLADALPASEIGQLKAQAESMSLEELAEYALKALEEVRAELGSAEPGEPDTAGQAIPAPAAGQSAITQNADGK